MTFFRLSSHLKENKMILAMKTFSSRWMCACMHACYDVLAMIKSDEYGWLMTPALAYSWFDFVFQFRYVTVMLLHHHLLKNYGLESQAFPEKVGIRFMNPEMRPRVVLQTMRHMKQLMGQGVKTHSIMLPTYSPCILNQQHQMMKDITICLKLQPNLISN